MKTPLTHPRWRHPLTGQPIIALGVTKRGTPIWPVMGGSQPAGEPTGGTGDGASASGEQSPPTTGQPPAPPGGTGSPQQPATGEGDPYAALQAIVTDLGLTPEQVTGRLAASRKWEDRAKGKDPEYRDLLEKAKQLDELQTAAMSEQERAVKVARDEGRAAGLAEAAGQLVEAHLRVAIGDRLTGDQIAALLGPLDRRQFLSGDGAAVDMDKVNAYAGVIAPARTPAAPAPQPPATEQPATGTTAPPATGTPAAPQPATGTTRVDMGQGTSSSAPLSGLAAGRELARQRFGTQGKPAQQ